MPVAGWSSVNTWWSYVAECAPTDNWTQRDERPRIEENHRGTAPPPQKGPVVTIVILVIIILVVLGLLLAVRRRRGA